MMNLLEAEVGKTYEIKEIRTDDDEMNAFLFRLGCYSGEPITIADHDRDQGQEELRGRHQGRQIQSGSAFVRSCCDLG